MIKCRPSGQNLAKNSFFTMHRVRLWRHVNTNQTWTKRQQIVIFFLLWTWIRVIRVLFHWLIPQIQKFLWPLKESCMVRHRPTSEIFYSPVSPAGQQSRLKTKGDPSSLLLRRHPRHVSTISRECLEGISSNLVQMSTVTQGWTD